MAQGVKALAAKPDDLLFIPGAHTVKERTNSSMLSSSNFST